MDVERANPMVGRFGHSEDQLRLMVKVARMYHERGLRQSQIAAELHVSQPRVSRLLKRAEEVGIVRTTVALPTEVHTDLEERLEAAYGLGEAVVVDVGGNDEDVVPALGAATAVYLDTTLTGGDTVGIASWSATLLAAVERMRPARTSVVDTVVQLVGGVGEPRVQMQATRLLGQFAAATGASPVFMSAPGLLGSARARATIMADPTLAEVMSTWARLTTVLVGIGSLEPSPLLRESGNALPDDDQGILRAAGAVGDICQRFFDAAGEPVLSAVDERVVGISADALRRVPRRVGVAGGPRKHSAVRAALLGGWVNVLITDLDEAERLLADAG
ncbi:sugar-binding transcriptional regulator [Actinotalea sp. M2MS4P-6]|uniref:sugar-binding transcriptional regulator n=1 Tax=Actinotalea sp. M2MS4P-6 TaxID=2983762 RepID=UPI0021E36FBC|nr:sugar-binding transcriptional regulator [Actinotalea sp. M2MS4P-6]MCV2394204.1 sugar-binding transcriptional regulator [Actinotalea sp. M2MS4P-6]